MKSLAVCMHKFPKRLSREWLESLGNAVRLKT
jgi:hypothetical protein